MRQSGEAVVKSIGTAPPLRALDLGCGDGATAVPFRRFYGPTMNAYESAGKSGTGEKVHHGLLELAKTQNESSNGGTSIPATFLRVTVCL